MKNKLYYKISCRNQLIVIVLAWLIVQITLFILTGIKPVLESLKYINAAKQLITTGTLPEIRYLFYLSTTLVIAFCLQLKLGYVGVVFFQLIINFLATIHFYHALKKVQRHSFSALITTLLLILCIPYQSWNFYLYTESLFYSFTLLFFASCISTKIMTAKTIFIQFTWLLFAIISRPLGILFLPCWLLFLINKSKRQTKPYLIIGLFIGSAFFLFIANLILGNIRDWQILKPAEFNYIICDIPTDSKNDLQHLKDKTPIVQLVRYVIAYPTDFIRLVVERLAAFYLLVRSYYSKFHNLYLLFLCCILYVPIVINAFNNFKRKTYFKNLYLSSLILLMFTFAISLQCDDYHNRFHHTLIPVFAYCGLFYLLDDKLLLKSKLITKIKRIEKQP